MKMLVPSICSLSFCQDPHLQAIHHSRFHCHLVNVPFLSCYYHSVTNSPWHLFPPVLPYLHFLLNLSCALSISLHGWPQVLKFIYLPYSCFLKLWCYSCLHVIWRCILSFFYSLFIPLLSRPYLCLPGPSLQITMLSANSPQRLLPDLNCHLSHTSILSCCLHSFINFFLCSYNSSAHHSCS